MYNKGMSEAPRRSGETEEVPDGGAEDRWSKLKEEVPFGGAKPEGDGSNNAEDTEQAAFDAMVDQLKKDPNALARVCAETNRGLDPEEVQYYTSNPDNIPQLVQKFMDMKKSERSSADDERAKDTAERAETVEEGYSEVVDHYREHPEEISSFVADLIKLRGGAEAISKGATWDAKQRAYIDESGAPRDWSHLTGYLRKNPEQIVRFVKEYESLSNTEATTESEPEEDAAAGGGEEEAPAPTESTERPAEAPIEAPAGAGADGATAVEAPAEAPVEAAEADKESASDGAASEQSGGEVGNETETVSEEKLQRAIDIMTRVKNAVEHLYVTVQGSRSGEQQMAIVMQMYQRMVDQLNGMLNDTRNGRPVARFGSNKSEYEKSIKLEFDYAMASLGDLKANSQAMPAVLAHPIMFYAQRIEDSLKAVIDITRSK